MEKCLKCKVDIASNTDICPLCKTPIEKGQTEDVFPKISFNYKHHYLLLNILKVCSLIAIIICVFINFTISRSITWAWFVIAGILSFWLTLVTALKGRKHFMKMLFAEMLLIIIVSIIWDYFTGFNFWSINYCLPFLCSIYTIAIMIMRIFRSNLAKEFIFYATINSMIGLVPGILLIFNKVTVVWPSYISVIISIIVLVFLTVFNKRQVKNELERRFHI